MSEFNFKKIYSLPIDEFENISYKETESFVFQGSKNWDMYFSKSLNNIQTDLFENVVLLDFQDKREFETYLSKVSKDNLIDYSLEHFFEKSINKYFVLVNKNG